MQDKCKQCAEGGKEWSVALCRGFSDLPARGVNTIALGGGSSTRSSVFMCHTQLHRTVLSCVCHKFNFTVVCAVTSVP